MEEILKNYKAIIFDMDGVIVNSLNFWKQTEQKLLSSFGIEKDLNNFHQTESMSTKEAIVFWLTKYPQKNISIASIEEFVLNEMTDLIENNDCINNDVKDLIIKLNQENYVLGLATNSPKKIMEVVLKKANLDTCFQAILTADEVEKVKPNPEIYIKTAAKLNVNPKDCIVIEDSDYGLIAARNAGMDIILYKDGKLMIQ